MDAARLKWQCRRGMLELDLMLEAFVDKVWPTLSEAEHATFDTLLDYPDQLLFDYLLGNGVPTDGEMMRVIEQIRQAAAD